MIPNEYRSWSFTDRSFLFAASVSVLWHFFWFFAVTIIVAPFNSKKASGTKIVSLGPVLNDAIFRTLVESRPELSEAFYRNLSDLQATVELPAQTIERHSSGDIQSIPSGKNFSKALKSLIGGEKAVAEGPSAISELFGGSDFFEFAGDVSKNQILSRPDPPALDLTAEIEIEFTLEKDGRLADLVLVRSCGDTQTDRRWENYLRQWLFVPMPVIGEGGKGKGRVIFRNPAQSDKADVSA